MKEKIKKLFKNKKTLTVIALVLLMLVTVGVTYAAFNYMGAGQTLNTLTTGTVTMTYNEAKNGISITNALPVEDCTGEKSTDTFDFTMSIDMKGDFKISYEVTAEKDEASTLSDDDVRIYLERSEDGTNYEAVSGPNSYTMIGNEDEFGASANEMILDVGTVTKSVDYKYRLKMWLSKNAEVDGTSKFYTIKVNVYGKDGTYDASAYGRDELLNEDTKDECSSDTPDTPSITPESKVKEYCELDENKDKASCKAPSSCTDGSCNDEVITGPAPSDGSCTNTMVYDGTSDNNLRYIGKHPCNYVKFNNELWRIIGSMNNIDDGTGKKEKRMKIVKNEIAYNQVYFNDSSTNNDYSQSTIENTLNETYYNSLSTEAKEMIGSAVWHLGESDNADYFLKSYLLERDTKVPSGHSTVWLGIFGLMYPSDYMFISVNKDNNYLFVGNETFINPCNTNAYGIRGVFGDSSYHGEAFCIGYYGEHQKQNFRPAVYLKSSVSITGGSGTESDPYTLGDTGSSISKEDDNATYSVDLKSSIEYIKSYKETDGKKIPQYAYKSSKSLEPAGTVDVYINNTLVASNVSEYHGEFKKGTKYEFKVNKSESPYTYAGVSSGVLSGTVGSKNVVTKLKYRYNRCKITYDPNGGKFTNNVNTTVQYMKYGDTTHAENDTLRNANGGHFSAVRSGYIPKVGAEWKCSGKACAQDTYDEDKKYNATDICSGLADRDKSVTLKVNWVAN